VEKRSEDESMKRNEKNMSSTDEESRTAGLLGEVTHVGETLLYKMTEDGPEGVGVLLAALPPDEVRPARLRILGRGGRIDEPPRSLCRRG